MAGLEEDEAVAVVLLLLSRMTTVEDGSGDFLYTMDRAIAYLL